MRAWPETCRHQVLGTFYAVKKCRPAAATCSPTSTTCGTGANEVGDFAVAAAAAVGIDRHNQAYCWVSADRQGQRISAERIWAGEV